MRSKVCPKFGIWWLEVGGVSKTGLRDYFLQSIRDKSVEVDNSKLAELYVNKYLLKYF